MLSDEVIDKVIERLVRRIEQGNEYVLRKIGESIKKIGTLSPSKAHELAQILKYGGDYDKITKKLAEITKLNEKDIYKIFKEVAKHDYQFAKQFYDYRKVKYIKWDENKQLQDQVNAIAKITADKYKNMSKTYAFATHNKKGRVVYTKLSTMYQQVLDEAIINVGQGKETFDSAMRRTLRELAQSGIRYIDYDNNRSVRADSALRMNLKDGLLSLHNELQETFGKEFDADGVEITVHANPAPDHEEAQGRQFSYKQFKRLQKNGVAVDYSGKEINMHRELKDGTITNDFRPISKLNCYHKVFSIVLGISKPEYTDEQLQQIIDKNNKGFDFEGRHYTMYEGTQLQRKLETAIREQKDKQIYAVSQDDKVSIAESQEKIAILTSKYKKLCNASGLPTKENRMRVSGFKRVAKSKLI